MAERAVEPGCTVFSSCEIRVVLLPVGDVPQAAWDEYASLIARHTKMELRIMRSFYHEQQKSPFTHMPWTTGSLHFTYLWGAEAEAQAAVTQRSVVSASHKVMGVIGICHCPSQTSMSEAYATFEQKCRMYPDAFTLRCFAFEPSDSPEQQGNKSAAYLITFPTGDDRTKLEYHLGVMMNDFAACLLMELEKWMLNASPAMINMSTWLDSSEFAVPVSTLEEVQKRLTSDEEVARKRRLGRLRKAMGDHCLLAGSPRNAEEHYSTAIDLARAVNDFIWLGAAIEGQIACKVLRAVCENVVSQHLDTSPLDEAATFIPSNLLESKGSSTAHGRQVSVLSNKLSRNLGEDEDVLEALRGANVGDEMLELFLEARAAYHKPKAVFLKLELDLKHARLLASLYGDVKRKAILDLLNGAIELAKLLDRPEDSLVATMEAAGICASIGAERKRALLLWRVTELCRTWDEPRPILATRALALVRQALLPNLTTPGEWMPRPRTPSDARPLEQGGTPKGGALIQSQSSQTDVMLQIPAAIVTPFWPTIHCAVLEALLGASTRTRSHQLAWRAAAAILGNFTNRLDERRQQWLLETLQVASKFTDRNVLRGPGPPPLLDLVKIHRPQEWLRPIDVFPKENLIAKKGPFIFTPFDIEVNKVENGIRWVVGEECRVDVEVSNPCSMLLHVERMSLAGFYEEEIQRAGDAIPYPKPRDYTNWRGVAKKVSMPPHTPPSVLDLTGVPKAPGRLYITGCYVQMFGVAWHQPWRNGSTSGEKLSEPLVSAANARERATNHASYYRGLAVDVVPPLQLIQGELRGERLLGSSRRQVLQQSVAEEAPQPALPQPQPHGGEDEAAIPGAPRALEAVVYEGEVFSWLLSLKNIGQQDIVGAVLSSQVKFLTPSDASDTPRMLGRGGAASVHQPGVDVTISRATLQQRLPLAPCDAVDVPISVQIGQSVSASQTECRVSIKLEYVGLSAVTTDSAAPASSVEHSQSADPAPSPPSNSDSSTGQPETATCQRLGRRLELPVTLLIRRMLKIVSCEVYCKDVVKSVVRGSDDQETETLCCIELSVENTGCHTYCAWLSERVGGVVGEGAAGSGASAIAPGSCASVGTAVWVPLGEGDGATSAKRMARHISDTWGLHWRQLPRSPDAGDSAAAVNADMDEDGALPRGVLPIHEAMVGSAITDAVVQALAPSSVRVEYRAKAPQVGDTPETHARLVDVASLLQARNVSLPEGTSFRAAALLGCTTSIGTVLQVSVSCTANVSAALLASVQCTRLFGLELRAGPQGDTQLSPTFVDGSNTPGAYCYSGMGVLQDFVLHITPGDEPRMHHFGLCFLLPGLYEIRLGSLRRYRSAASPFDHCHQEESQGIETGLSVSECRLHILVTDSI